MISTTATGLILTAGIALSPPAIAAQTPENPPATTTIAQQPARSTPTQYLGEAERLLNGIPQDSPKLKKDAAKRFSELRDRFAELVKAYQANGDPFVPAAVNQEADVKSDKKSAPVNWKESFSDVEHDLAVILGGGGALPPSTTAGAGSIVAGSAAPVGTSGTTTAPVLTPGATASTTQISGNSNTSPTPGVGTAAVVGDVGTNDLDPEVRRQLEQFRLELELFFGAATTMNLETGGAR